VTNSMPRLQLVAVESAVFELTQLKGVDGRISSCKIY
jgi:hypothetical protein